MLAWYEARGPDYPWRRTADDAYAVLVSEVMLQQTQAGRVRVAFPRFLERFPTVTSLASATRAEVVKAWAGMGYNRRAVALHEAARAIVGEHAGIVPSDPGALRRLPGVGPYTAAAVASIAYGVPVAAVDTNVSKVMARLDLGVEREDIAPVRAAEAAAAWLDPDHPGDWNQAVMNLGHSVCRPSPRCDECPFAGICRYRLSGRAESRQRHARSGGSRPGHARSPGNAPHRTGSPFEGSVRQLRGAVVEALRQRTTMTVAGVARATGRGPDEVAVAVGGLARDGIVAATEAALEGRPRGRVWLAESPAHPV